MIVLAEIEAMMWWERVLWGVVAMIFVPLCVLVVGAIFAELTSWIWVRLPRRNRRTWLAVLIALLSTWLLYGVSTDTDHSGRELEGIGAGSVWHAITRYGPTGWLVVEERNTDILLRSPPISQTVVLNPLGLVLQVCVVLVTMYAGFRAWRWNVNRFTLRDRSRCAECGYDLRGCKEPGCPECGWNREQDES